MPTCSEAEDCLFLDIYTPADATVGSRLPVWVFIQGGAYSGLCCNGNNTEVTSRGNIVVVSMSYRVGAFGFLASEQIRANGDLNIGLLDQRAALKWTRDYIQQVDLSNFGSLCGPS